MKWTFKSKCTYGLIMTIIPTGFTLMIHSRNPRLRDTPLIISTRKTWMPSSDHLNHCVCCWFYSLIQTHFFLTWYYSYCFFYVKCSVTPIERTSLPGLWDTSLYVHLYPGCPCEFCMWVQVRAWLCVCKCVLSYTWACLNVRSTKQQYTWSYVVMPKHFSGYFSVVKQ